jgi:glycosyltransferase involved in cell wall biosynthesis
MDYTSKVSIIIPTRDRKELLFDAINSVLKQTHENIQLIVHDNNSTDGTEELIPKKIKDSRVEFYHSNCDLTMTENWNKAFSYVKGEYFLRLDDDNVISNDFVESALSEIKRLNLDLINFSPVVIHLNNKIYSIFDEKDKTYLLNKFQLAYLEYFNCTDSNNSLCRTELVRNLFSDGNVYQTTLPDRYINLNICERMDKLNIRVGMSTLIKGATRYDYRPSLPQNYELIYVDYKKFPIFEIMNLKDCKNNFYMHRAATFSYFLSSCRDKELARFINDKVINPKLYVTLMNIGHIYMARSAFSLNELYIYFKYSFLVLSGLIENPKSIFEGRNSVINLAVISKNIIRGSANSFFNILLGRKREAESIDMKLGNRMVKKILNGESVSSFLNFSERGNLGAFLKKIINLKI